MNGNFFYFIRDVTGRVLPCTMERAAYYLGRSRMPYTHLFTPGKYSLCISPYNGLIVKKKEDYGY